MTPAAVLGDGVVDIWSLRLNPFFANLYEDSFQ